MNRRQRRAAAKQQKTALNRLKLRCLVCEAIVRSRSKEHFFPTWLTTRANAKWVKVSWLGDKPINPSKVTIPICEECNNALGSQLETPVQTAFDCLETGVGITVGQAEFLVRWMWKFEGMAWHIQNATNQTVRYSPNWTLQNRVLGDAIESIRPRLALAVSIIELNDEGYDEWPVGLDSPIMPLNAIFVSGVFCKTALMVLLEQFTDLVPSEFDIYRFPPSRDDTDTEMFKPGTGFRRCADAINATVDASIPLVLAHEELAEQMQQNNDLWFPPPRRVELP